MQDSLGERIKKYRKSKGLTQSDLAKKLNKSVRMIQKYEANDVAPNLEMLDNIAEALGINRNALLTVKKSYRPDITLEMTYDFFEEVYNHSRVKEEIGLNAKEFMEKDKYFIGQLMEEFIQTVIFNSRVLKEKILNGENIEIKNPIQVGYLTPFKKPYELGQKLNNLEYLKYIKGKIERYIAAAEMEHDNHKTLEEEAKKTKGKYDDQGENNYRFAVQEDINNFYGE